MERIFLRALGPLEGLLATEGSAANRLLLIGQHAAATKAQMGEDIPISLEFYALANRKLKVREFLSEYFQGSYEVIGALVQQGVDSGEFRPLDAQAVAVLTGALFEGLGLLWMIDPESVDWQRHPQVAFELLLRGLRA